MVPILPRANHQRLSSDTCVATMLLRTLRKRYVPLPAPHHTSHSRSCRGTQVSTDGANTKSAGPRWPRLIQRREHEQGIDLSCAKKVKKRSLRGVQGQVSLGYGDGSRLRLQSRGKHGPPRGPHLLERTSRSSCTQCGTRPPKTASVAQSTYSCLEYRGPPVVPESAACFK